MVLLRQGDAASDRGSDLWVFTLLGPFCPYLQNVTSAHCRPRPSAFLGGRGVSETIVLYVLLHSNQTL